MSERDERDEWAPLRDEATGPVAPGNLDEMPHIYQPVEGGGPRDEQGNVIPPARESGRAGSDDVTWRAGKPKPTFDDTDEVTEERAP